MLKKGTANCLKNTCKTDHQWTKKTTDHAFQNTEPGRAGGTLVVPSVRLGTIVVPCVHLGTIVVPVCTYLSRGFFLRQVPSGENTHEVPKENTLQILGQNMTSSAQASALGNNTPLLPAALIPKEIQPVTGNDVNLSNCANEK